jgi:putative tryptophan/tyrosine transport system substrate-binding protein
MKRRQFVTGLAGAVAWPLAARTQPNVLTPRIGLLLASSADGLGAALRAFRQGLTENGLDPEKDVELQVRGSSLTQSLERSAAELADWPASVLVGSSVPEVLALKRAAPRTPIVMVAVGDPVATRLATSLERPGGLVTGLSDFRPDYAESRLRLLIELLPSARRVGFLHNPDAPTASLTYEAALRFGVNIVPLAVHTSAEIGAVLASAANIHMDAVLVAPFPASFQKRRAIGEWAAKRGLPLVFGYSEFMDLPGEIAGVAAFGSDLLDLYRRAAGYAAAILRGAIPAELAIQRPEKGELVINLAAARRLHLTFPDDVIRRAARIIQ